MQMLDKLPGMGTKKDVGRGETTVSRWLKAQAQMLYSSGHNDIWVHKGFLTVGHLSLNATPLGKGS